MSPIENDLFRWFWELPPVAILIIAQAWSPGLVWVAEVIRWRTEPNRPPWGVGIFRWTTVVPGDLLFISSLLATVAIWLQEVEVNSSFFSSRELSVLAIILGTIQGLVFLLIDNRSWGKNQINWNRAVHLPYFFIASILLWDGGLRAIGDGLIGGHEQGIALAALMFLLPYFACLLIDIKGWNDLANKINEKWPKP